MKWVVQAFHRAIEELEGLDMWSPQNSELTRTRNIPPESGNPELGGTEFFGLPVAARICKMFKEQELQWW